MTTLFHPAKPAAVAALPFSKFKTLGMTKGAWAATCYILHKTYIAQVMGIEWVKISSVVMGGIAGNRNVWSKVKRLLIEHDFLQCDESYFVGEISMGFALGVELQGEKFKAIPNKFTFPEKFDVTVEGLTIDLEEAEKIIWEIAPARGWSGEAIDLMLWRVRNFNNRFKECSTGRTNGP